VPLGGSGGTQNSFKLNAGNDIRKGAVTIDIICMRVKGFEPGGQNDRSHLNLMSFFLLIKIHSIRRAEFLTGSAFPLFKIDTVIRVNHIFEGHSLGILDIGCLAFRKTLIVFIIHLAGAFFSAYSAGNTFSHIHIARAFTDGHCKMPSLAFNGFHIRQSDEIDVQMPADLDQFG